MRLSAHNYVTKVWLRGKCRRNFGIQGSVDDQDLGPALDQKIGVVGSTERGVSRNRDSADLHHAKIGGRELGTIREKQQNSLFFLNAECTEPGSNPIDLLGYLGVSSPLIVANDGGPIAAAFSNVAIYEMVDYIELFGKLSRWH